MKAIWINKKIIQSALAACAVCCLFVAAKKADQAGSVRIQEETVTISGIRRDYRMLLIADTHISLCDARDPVLLKKAQARREAFERESGKNAVRTFHNLVTESVEGKDDLTIFAGDRYYGLCDVCVG